MNDTIECGRASCLRCAEGNLTALCELVLHRLGPGQPTHVTVSSPPHRLEIAAAEARGRASRDQEVAALTTERDEARADVVFAAGELLVPIPAPGSTASRLLLANVAMRRERDAARAEAGRLTAALRAALEYGAHCVEIARAASSSGGAS